MTYDWPLYFCLFLALWSAMVGGTFKAFSEFIMSGLLRAAPAGGIESMQQINRTVLKTEFVGALIAIAFLSTAFALYAAAQISGLALNMLIFAPLAYVPSVFLMTIFGNVPMNKKLEALDHRSPEAEIYWKEYGRVWTRLNHFRTIGCIVTAGAYIVAAIALITSGQA
jgi:uncharacterized membrane protein